MAWFFAIVVAMFSLAGSLGIVIAKTAGVDIEQVLKLSKDSSPELIRAALIIQGAGNFLAFLVPPLLFAYFTHPRPAQYLGLRPPSKKVQYLLVILIMLGASPLLMVIEGLVGHFNFGPAVKQQQEAMENTMNAFLNNKTFMGFVVSFIIMAIVPAMGEEMFFRGAFLRLMRRRSKSMVFPIIFTSLIFAGAHGTLIGFISITLAGILLAVIYNLTGSLWCNIVGHCFFNGFQVMLSYAGNSNPAIKSFTENSDMPVVLVVGGAVLFCVSFYLLLRNKTPLPPDWADDFSGEERAGMEGAA